MAISKAIARAVARLRVSTPELLDVADGIEELLTDPAKERHLTSAPFEVNSGRAALDLETNTIHKATAMRHRKWMREIYTGCGENLWDVSAEKLGQALIGVLLATREGEELAWICSVCFPASSLAEDLGLPVPIPEDSHEEEIERSDP